MSRMPQGVPAALGSAVLFGVSTPMAKLLVGTTDPWLLAGMLYLASGLGLSLLRLIRPMERTPVGRSEWGWLAGAIACGGVLGPVLLMWGLTATTGSAAALLLNAEGVFTALLAWFVFHENVDRRIAIGMAAIVAGAVLLSWSGPVGSGPGWGAPAILGACACWALDNNLTRKVSLADPVRIAGFKGLAAGTVNTALALAMHADLPSPLAAGVTAIVGFMGYGVSLVLFVVALRDLGTARAGAYFSVAPFVGALLAVILFDEPVTVRLALATLLMAAGVALHLRERHEHDHRHAAIEHDHVHRHDEHHDHAHPTGEEEHGHSHRHAAVIHRHPHYPDAHHRHSH